MRRLILSSLVVVAFTVACHGNAPSPAPAPDPSEAEIAMHRHIQDSLDAVARTTADSVERVRQLALAAQARADSIEQARMALEAEARATAAKSAALRDELGVMVHFDVARSQIDGDARAALDRKVAILNANPGVRLQITGACDERGSDSYNLALGKRRAAAAKKYLMDQGIDVARLEGVSTGEASPIDSGSGEAAWAQNRRAEFMIVSGDTPLAMN
ncbi:MAG: OmpA family protein [Gemmatimonadales bacterium]